MNFHHIDDIQASEIMGKIEELFLKVKIQHKSLFVVKHYHKCPLSM